MEIESTEKLKRTGWEEMTEVQKGCTGDAVRSSDSPIALTVYVMAASIPIKVRELMENDSAAKPSVEEEQPLLTDTFTTAMFIFIIAI